MNFKYRTLARLTLPRQVQRRGAMRRGLRRLSLLRVNVGPAFSAQLKAAPDAWERAMKAFNISIDG
jgi:hypothetical protein